MKSRKGFTIIEVLVLVAIIAFMATAVIGICLVVKGCNHVIDTIETTADNIEQERADRLVSNPPLYAIGDIVYHKASDEKMVVAKNTCFWNKIKEGWDIKVKDGGNWDKVGGFGINETEVKPTLKEVGKESPEVEKK